MNRPVPAQDVRRDDVVAAVVEQEPELKGLIFLVGFIGFVVLVELGIAVAVTL